jgi:diaminopimelate epimerase
VLVIEKGGSHPVHHSEEVDFFFRIFNADTSEANQCGNGARAVARFIRDKGLSDKPNLVLGTRTVIMRASFLVPEGAERSDQYLIEIDMGSPRFDPEIIPLVHSENPQGQEGASWISWEPESATFEIELATKERVRFGAVNVGNPHAVIVVEGDVNLFPVGVLAPVIQRLPVLPESANIGFLQVISRKEARLRVYERGAGETLACGSGACAAFAIARRRDLLDDEATIHLRGGDLFFSWDPLKEGSSLRMTGPALFVFEGHLDL